MTKMNSFGQVSSSYLDINELVEGVKFEKLAFVYNRNAGTTKMGDGYFTFYVKDINSNSLRAQLFNCKDFIDKGLIATALINKPVKMKFIAQKFCGKWSLIIEEIELWEGDFDYKPFRGTVVCESDQLQKSATEIMGDGYSIPYEYQTVSLPTICDGRCGGYLKLVDGVWHGLLGYLNLPTINGRGLFKVFFYVIEIYYSYLVKKSKFPEIASSELFDMLLSVERRAHGDEFYLEIMDACRAVIGTVKPQHIYSHIILKSIAEHEKLMDLIYTNASLAKGSLTTVGGEQLLRN